jgi:hypothetical protein
MTQTLAPFKLLSPARRDAIVDDLLKKRPSQGPVPHVVSDEESYCSRYNEYRTLPVSDHPGWGYTDETLYRTGLRSENQVREYCINRFYGGKWDHDRWGETAGKKAGLSRKVNRLTERLAARVGVIQNEGTQPALYAVKTGSGYYGGTLIGYVFGSNKDHAAQLATAFYGHLTEEGSEIKVVWAGYPTLRAYEKAVQKMQKEAESTKTDLEARIEKLKKSLVDDQNRAAATAMMLMQQLEDFSLAEMEPTAAAAK